MPAPTIPIITLKGARMHLSSSSLKNLDTVVDLMRELSTLTDPQEAAELYGNGLDKLNLVPSDRYLSLSRRDLKSPQFRITRNTSWTIHPNPWKERDQLPLLSGGLLADILYSDQPAIIDDLPARLAKTDPAYDYLHDMKLLVALPHFDNGRSINAGVLLQKEAAGFPLEDIPMMIWQANLWGRATLNLVNRQKLDAAYQSLDRELKVVGDIQKSLLPRTLPQIPGVDIAAHYQTSQRAGGDYYDFFPLPENRWGIFVADVSGHGTPAAVMMAITHAIAHSRPGNPMPPCDVLVYLNKQLTTRYTNGTPTFITALYAIIDPASRILTYASAGHPPPRLIRNRAPMDVPAPSAYPLGIEPDETYLEHSLRLLPGDRLVLYTDGITESMNPAGELFQLKRLDAAASTPAVFAEALINNILSDIGTFTHGAPLTDDRTLLAFLVR
jgi:phosphoserine phosphatase RsbU/P